MGNGFDSLLYNSGIHSMSNGLIEVTGTGNMWWPLREGSGLLLTTAIHKKSMLDGNHVMSPITYIYIYIYIYIYVSTSLPLLLFLSNHQKIVRIILKNSMSFIIYDENLKQFPKRLQFLREWFCNYNVVVVTQKN